MGSGASAEAVTSATAGSIGASFASGWPGWAAASGDSKSNRFSLGLHLAPHRPDHHGEKLPGRVEVGKGAHTRCTWRHGLSIG